jgi:hypothetical protein
MQSLKNYLAAAMVALAALGASACSDDDEPASFTATLSSQAQVPPGSTPATGSATFNFDGNSTVQYTINVTGLMGPTSARVHSGSEGETGQARVDLTLAEGVAGGGSGNGGSTGGGTGGTGDPGTAFSGELARSSFTEADVQGISFDSLIEEMREGRAYVVVNTSGNPSGELRGQIRLVE